MQGQTSSPADDQDRTVRIQIRTDAGAPFHLPLLVRVLGFDVHVATATSHLILAIAARSDILVHVVGGALHRGLVRTSLLAVGVVIGAQLGAKASSVVHGRWIMRSLAVALDLVGIRLLMIGLQGFVGSYPNPPGSARNQPNMQRKSRGS